MGWQLSDRFLNRGSCFENPKRERVGRVRNQSPKRERVGVFRRSCRGRKHPRAFGWGSECAASYADAPSSLMVRGALASEGISLIAGALVFSRCTDMRSIRPIAAHMPTDPSRG